jgi:hypothetical protein
LPVFRKRLETLCVILGANLGRSLLRRRSFSRKCPTFWRNLRLHKKTMTIPHVFAHCNPQIMSKRSQLFLLPLSEAQPPKGILVFIILLVALYAPFGWIVLFQGPWDEHRVLWLKSVPTLPGFIVRSLVFLEGQPEWLNYSLMGLVTVLVLSALWQMGRRSYLAMVFAFVVGAAFSSWNAWMAYQAFAG